MYKIWDVLYVGIGGDIWMQL